MKWTEEDKERLNEFINELLYEKMDIEDYEKVMNRLGCDCKGNRYRTICHNIEGGKYNLGFNKDNRYFTCYSECGCRYSLLGLVKKVLELRGESRGTINALRYICDIVGIECNFKGKVIKNKKEEDGWYDWKKLLKYKNKNIDKVNKIYDKDILYKLDRVVYEPWVDEGIGEDIQWKWGIRWYDRKQQVVIPVLNQNGELVGTHCRNTNQELVDLGMKYDHLRLLDGKEYKFNMGLELFGLNYNAVNIARYKTFILVESPKSVMQFDNFDMPNICVGMFGMNFSLQKLKLLLTFGAENVIIALDKQYKEINNIEDSEWDKYKKKINRIVDICQPYMKEIKVIYDNEDLLDYKDSPTDKGEIVFKKLLERAEIL